MTTINNSQIPRGVSNPQVELPATPGKSTAKKPGPHEELHAPKPDKPDTFVEAAATKQFAGDPKQAATAPGPRPPTRQKGRSKASAGFPTMDGGSKSLSKTGSAKDLGRNAANGLITEMGLPGAVESANSSRLMSAFNEAANVVAGHAPGAAGADKPYLQPDYLDIHVKDKAAPASGSAIEPSSNEIPNLSLTRPRDPAIGEPRQLILKDVMISG